MTIKFDILNRLTGKVQFTAEIECGEGAPTSIKLGLAVKWAVKNKIDLSGSNLSGSNLSGSNLRGSNLSYSDLRGSDLSGSNLSGSNLSYSDLLGSDLRGSDLRGSNLRYSNLRYSDLRGSNLSDSNLSGSNLSGSNLRGSDLRGSNLSGSNLSGSKGSELAIAKTRIVADGDLIGWKKCNGNVVVKLRIPAEAKRSHAFGRKCRAEFADVLEVIGADVGISQHDGKTKYRAGARVTPDGWSEDWQQECAPGIHFYITRIEAENH